MLHSAPANVEPSQGRDAVGLSEVPGANETRTVAELQQALSSGRSIGMAIGIMMRVHQISDTAAHAMLVRISQNTNVKLRIVAAEIVATANLTFQAEPAQRGDATVGGFSPDETVAAAVDLLTAQ